MFGIRVSGIRVITVFKFIEFTPIQMKKHVLDTFTPTKAHSMTPSGQCRLSAIIPWTYDSSRMMEILGKLLRLLHRSLPWDTLEGHRQRFVGLYNDLRIVYEKLSSIQYLRGILQVTIFLRNLNVIALLITVTIRIQD